MDINDRAALVTGTNRGIGLHIVHALLNDGVAKVYAGARDPQKLNPLVKQYGERVVPVQLDVTKAKDVNAAAKLAKDVTILVNNAGALLGKGPLTGKDTLKNLKGEWEVNVVGVLRVAQAFAPVLKKNGGGTIVNINSILSFRGVPSVGTYCASKAASYSLTQTLRHELTPQGIHLVSVFPSLTDTEMNESVTGDKADPAETARQVVRAIREDHVFVFPDADALRQWKELESAPGPFLAAALPAEAR